VLSASLADPFAPGGLRNRLMQTIHVFFTWLTSHRRLFAAAIFIVLTAIWADYFFDLPSTRYTPEDSLRTAGEKQWT
jgi:hypothetical protein